MTTFQPAIRYEPNINFKSNLDLRGILFVNKLHLVTNNHDTMLEKIIKSRWYLQNHQRAPMLKEREEFLSYVASKRDYSAGYLHSLADYLLLITNKLELKDGDTERIAIEKIKEAAESWVCHKSNHPMKRSGSTPSSYFIFMDFAFAWLGYMDRLDKRYTEDSIINRLFSRKFHRIKYLTYPMLEQRKRHLEKWEKKGAKPLTLRLIANYQLHIIDFLHIEEGHLITEDVLQETALEWSQQKKAGPQSRNNGHEAYLAFIHYGKDWLSDLNMFKANILIYPNKEVVDAYLEYIVSVKGCAVTTAYTRQSVLKHFFDGNSSFTVKDITLSEIDFYIKSRHDDGCNRVTIASIISILRSFFTYTSENQLTDNKLLTGLNLPRIYKLEGLPSYVSWDIVSDILLEKSRLTTKAGIRDYAIVLLLAVYAIRCGEVVNLKLQDINWREETIYIRRSKNCKPQVFPLLPEVGNALLRYIKDVRFNDVREERVFLQKDAPHRPITNSAVYHMVSKALSTRNVEVKHRGAHCIRHSCATMLINTGHTLKEIADLLGHVQLDTTMIYAKVDMTNLRKVGEMNWEDLI